MSQGDASDDSDNCSSDNEPQGNDADGIWSPDIEQSFLEALAIYPPCGRRKIILSEEGKMYGRNELIARYIKLRTGKTRTRKQVSSHIQVLARRKSKEIQANVKDQTSKERIVQSLSSMSSSQIVSATALQDKSTGGGVDNHPMGSFAAPKVPFGIPLNNNNNNNIINNNSKLSPYSSISSFINGEMPSRHFNEDHHHNQQQQSRAYNAHLNYHTSSQQHHHHHHHQQQQNQQQQQQQEDEDYHLGQHHNPHPSSQHLQWNAGNQFKVLKYQAYVQSVKKGLTNRHSFIHLGNELSHLDYVQTISLNQLLDKFPDIPGGLPQLMADGPFDVFYLVKCWADLNTNLFDEDDAFYGLSFEYEGGESPVISISTKVCSFGKQVVEKVETDNGVIRREKSPSSSSSSSTPSPPSSSPPPTGQTFSFRNDRSCMCEYMISFINKLRKLPEKYMMNSVLENFTVIQVIRNNATNQILLCLAFVFEVADGENGSQKAVYQIFK